MQTQSLLPGVPIIESPFFNDIAASDYFAAHEKKIASDLNTYGFAILPGFFSAIKEQAKQIRADLQPLYDEMAISTTLAPEEIAAEARIQDAYRTSQTVKDIACDERITKLLTKLYGRQAFAFQTLNFRYGSQQATHSDAMHFHSAPERYMCGVWVALEDVHFDTGPLHYYPGSHKLPTYDCRQLGYAPTDKIDQTVYEALWEKLTEAHILEKQTFEAKAGDALIWSANLLHGGERILRAGTSRWSQVTHYFFEGCDYYTPMHSDVFGGEIRLRAPVDIATGLPLERPQVVLKSSPKAKPKPWYEKLFGWTSSSKKSKPKKPTLPTIPLPLDFDAAAYLHLNKDVAASGMDPITHYTTHGYLEKRPYKMSLPEDFNAMNYLELNPDVRQAGLTAAEHYMLHGFREKRRYKVDPK